MLVYERVYPHHFCFKIGQSTVSSPQVEGRHKSSWYRCSSNPWWTRAWQKIPLGAHPWHFPPWWWFPAPFAWSVFAGICLLGSTTILTSLEKNKILRCGIIGKSSRIFAWWWWFSSTLPVSGASWPWIISLHLTSGQACPNPKWLILISREDPGLAAAPKTSGFGNLRTQQYEDINKGTICQGIWSYIGHQLV